VNDANLNYATNGNGVRRRRSWYRRRLRMQRTFVAVVVGTLLAGACWQIAVHYLVSPSLRSPGSPNSSWLRANAHRNVGLLAARSARPMKVVSRIPGVYPYSVVPGGVKDVRDLRDAASRDSVVRRHFAHFDYTHAQLVRAAEAREVYLSYRIRNTVFWTRKKVRLHVGELLLTDGNITARAHCGNQISDTAKPEVSDEEPAEDVLDQPVAMMESPSMPIRPVLAALDLPDGQPIPPQFFAGGFVFPYVPFGVPIPGARCPIDDIIVDGQCHPKRRNHVTPEPSTMVLISFGLALILWRNRRIARPLKA
jgi:PEP-CTERM motif